VSTPQDILRISADDVAPSDDRFARHRLIAWWDQEKLAAARVLVIGAGALGNEIVKNLALLGIGNVLIADRDRIELSNLARSVLFREADLGEFKADVAARRAREIFPQMNVHAFNGDVVNALGAGAFRWADVVIGGLDNRETRLHVNRVCWKLGKPWIDGAIEMIQGVARAFLPDVEQKRPCYECTMTARDWDLLNQRRACNMLTREQMQTGHTPTTPTISSIIAGVQTQEAVKLIHGLDVAPARGFVFMGATCESYTVDYQRKPDCLSHDRFETIVELDRASDAITLRELLDVARGELGNDATLDLGRDIVERLECPACGKSEPVFAPLGTLRANRAICPCDGTTTRRVELFHTISGSESFLDRKLADSGVPAFDVIAARSGSRLIGFELSADAKRVLGPLPTGGLEWA
jgi:adenylyltransferase/sulfurtransferase